MLEKKNLEKFNTFRDNQYLVVGVDHPVKCRKKSDIFLQSDKINFEGEEISVQSNTLRG